VLLGCLTFLPQFQNTTAWTEYTKFDNNLRSLVRAYYREHPRREPEFQTGRRLLDGSFALLPTNLMALRKQGLIVRPMSNRPYVFLIVADALRGDTYSGGPPEHRYRYPGIAWMAERFVIYDNAWSSYNSTLGSYPAYLNGVMNPAWYQFTSDWPIHQDNTLARAADLAGYRCYNFATYDDELARLWPTNTAVDVGDAGLGRGDPGVVFSRALQLLDQHCETSAHQPALFYLHLYNLHQPLLRRPGIPLPDRGRHWMRALYEQNAAYFDQKLKAFLEALEQRKVLSKAVVLITGDHGEEVFDLGGLYHGWQINPWVMRVPLFIHYPTGTHAALPAGTISLRPVNLIDIAPTLCQVMGVSILRNSEWQGVNLLEPEPSTSRSFLLLSWETPLVGRVSFSPLRMLVMNLESGEEEAFVPSESGWSITAARLPPRELAGSINQELWRLFHYWRMDPEHGRYLPASVTEGDTFRRSH
jgi:hypothetical protein